MIIIGLDMYLSAKKYVSKREGYGQGAPANPLFEKVIDGSGLAEYCTDESVSIYGATVAVNAAYWRKANQIHNWFVNNVQDGNDNCGEYYVTDEQLEELRSLCNEVLANRGDTSIAEDLLPPASGFFFGSTDFDEWYYGDIEYTATRLKELLEMKGNNYDVSFYYQSSW